MSGANSERRSTTFVDKSGNTWSLSLNVERVERVRDLVGVDLLDLSEGDLATRLAMDDLLLAKITGAILEPEALAKNVEPKNFADAIADGEVLDSIFQALTGALVNFTRSSRRAIVGGLLDKANEAATKASRMAEEKIHDGTIDRIIDEELAKADANLSILAPRN